MLCNKIIGGSSSQTKKLPEEWEYFRTLANENESAFLVASGGIDTICFTGAAAFIMKVYGGADGKQLLYTLDSGSSKTVDLYSADIENYPLPSGLTFSKLAGKPYSDEIVGDVELFTIVTSGADSSPVSVAVGETEYGNLGLPYYRILACDVNIPASPTVRGLVKNTLELRCVFFKESMRAIPPHAFYNSGLRECEIPENITALNSAVFYGTPIEKVYFHDNIASIGEYVFSQCSYLKEVRLPPTLTTISAGLFNGCTSLNKVNIPTSCKKVFDTSFNGCRSLKHIDFPDTLTDFNPTSICSNCDVLDSFEVNANVTKVVNGTDMLAYCEQVKYIHMPHIRLRSFGCQGKNNGAKNKIGGVDIGDREPIVLDWANFSTSSTQANVWNTSFTNLTQEHYLSMFGKLYENSKTFPDKNFIITGSDGATDVVRDFITNNLGAVCVG